MRVTGQQDVDALAGPLDQHAAERCDVAVELVDGLQRPQPEIGGDLVVAGAAGVQLAGHRADFLVQQPLDERVHVFVGSACRGPVGQPLGHAVQPLEHPPFLPRQQHAHAAESVDPRLARRDVLRPEAVVHRETAVQRVERLARSQREPATPHLVRGVGGRWRGLGRLLGRHQSAAAALPIVRSRSAASPAPILIARP